MQKLDDVDESCLNFIADKNQFLRVKSLMTKVSEEKKNVSTSDSSYRKNLSISSTVTDLFCMFDQDITDLLTGML